MTTEQFIFSARKYYGDYSEVARAIVAAWLDKRLPRERAVIWEEVLKILSATYRTPPGIKELEEAWTRAINHRPHDLGPAKGADVPQIESETSEEYCTEEEAEYYFAELHKRMRAIGRKWKQAN
jgi:Arc/MetJ-type ribon-helix-helix transcriptional regulator